jgi:hypothetical protein
MRPGSAGGPRRADQRVADLLDEVFAGWVAGVRGSASGSASRAVPPAWHRRGVGGSHWYRVAEPAGDLRARVALARRIVAEHGRGPVRLFAYWWPVHPEPAASLVPRLAGEAWADAVFRPAEPIALLAAMAEAGVSSVRAGPGGPHYPQLNVWWQSGTGSVRTTLWRDGGHGEPAAPDGDLPAALARAADLWPAQGPVEVLGQFDGGDAALLPPLTRYGEPVVEVNGDPTEEQIDEIVANVAAEGGAARLSWEVNLDSRVGGRSGIDVCHDVDAELTPAPGARDLYIVINTRAKDPAATARSIATAAGLRLDPGPAHTD